MRRRGRRLLLLALGVAIILGVIASKAIWRARPPTRLRLVEVRSYVMTGQQPATIYGDVQVEADFDYSGLPLQPSFGALRRTLTAAHLAPPQTIADFSFGAVVLRDSDGHEIATLTNGAATPQTARIGWTGEGGINGTGQLTVLWNFKLPAGWDVTRPLHFSADVTIPPNNVVTIATTLPTSVASPASQPAAWER